MSFRKGYDNAQVSSGPGNFRPTTYFGWKNDGESKFLRFLTPMSEVIYVKTWWMRGPDGKGGTFICPKELDPSSPSPLESVDAKPRELGYGLAVLREGVLENGRLVGMKDVIQEFEEDGVKKTGPVVGIVSQAVTNFWNNLNTIEESRGEITHMDIEIIRRGTGLKTEYMPVPVPSEEIPNLQELYKPHAPDLEAMLKRQASEEWYRKRLHINLDGTPFVESAAAPAAASAPAAPVASSAPAPTAVAAVTQNEYKTGEDESAILERLRSRQAAAAGQIQQGESYQ